MTFDLILDETPLDPPFVEAEGIDDYTRGFPRTVGICACLDDALDILRNYLHKTEDDDLSWIVTENFEYYYDMDREAVCIDFGDPFHVARMICSGPCRYRT